MRKYSPTGDKLSEHITEAAALVADADVELAELLVRLRAIDHPPLLNILERQGRRMKAAQRHLRAAEAIRKSASARRQAALVREANKRS